MNFRIVIAFFSISFLFSACSKDTTANKNELTDFQKKLIGKWNYIDDKSGIYSTPEIRVWEFKSTIIDSISRPDTTFRQMDLYYTPFCIPSGYWSLQKDSMLLNQCFNVKVLKLTSDSLIFRHLPTGWKYIWVKIP
jgi:hypothetical protein